MGKRFALCLLALALVGTACSKKTTTTPGGSSGNAGSNTYTVQVDGKKSGQPINIVLSSYFPSQLSVHPGDSITFANNFSGEPHSVSFGTLVDTGLAHSTPHTDGPDLKKIPHMLPEGPGDANPVSVNPCYVATGDPTPATCKKEQPAFDGKYSFYSSGYLPENASFTMPIAKTTAPGTYRWFCTLHRTGMTGTLTVVAATASVPTPEVVKKTGDDAIAARIEALKPAAARAQAGPPGVAFAGAALPQFGPTALVAQFGPKTIAAKTGQTIKWTIIGPHTITFAPEAMMAQTQGALVKAPDGFHVNRTAFAPANAPPSHPTKAMGNITSAGSWNGVGELNSGFLAGFGPPGYLTWEVKISKKGSYKYHCAVHPDMEGTVNVT